MKGSLLNRRVYSARAASCEAAAHRHRAEAVEGSLLNRRVYSARAASCEAAAHRHRVEAVEGSLLNRRAYSARAASCQSPRAASPGRAACIGEERCRAARARGPSESSGAVSGLPVAAV